MAIPGHGFAAGKGSGIMAPHLLLTTLPRTASSMAIKCLEHATSRPVCPPRIYARKGTPLTIEDDLFSSDWEVYANETTVGKLHCRATSTNLAIVKKYGIRPCYLYRNLYDIIVSMRDHHDQCGRGQNNSIFAGVWNSLPPVQKINAIIDFYVPRFIFMHVTWRRANVPCFTFSDLVEDTAAVLGKMLDYAEISVDRTRLRSAVEKWSQSVHFNVGVHGRGASELTWQQKNRVRSMLSYFPNEKKELLC